MAMNPKMMMQAAQRIRLFHSQHPRFGMFLKDVGENAVRPGTIFEVKVTDPEGKEYISNIRLTAEDVETIQMAKSAGLQ